MSICLLNIENYISITNKVHTVVAKIDVQPRKIYNNKKLATN